MLSHVLTYHFFSIQAPINLCTVNQNTKLRHIFVSIFLILLFKYFSFKYMKEILLIFFSLFFFFLSVNLSTSFSMAVMIHINQRLMSFQVLLH